MEADSPANPKAQALTEIRRGAYAGVMFLLFGTSLRDQVLTVVHFVCTACGVAAPQHVIERATKISVFFVPLFTVGRRHSVVCTNCGSVTTLTREQAEHGLEWAEQNRQVG